MTDPNKMIGFYAKLGVDDSNGTSFTDLVSIVDGWTGPDAKAKTVDTSLLGDKYDTFAVASKDPGSVGFDYAYDPAHSDTTTLADLFDSGDVANWRITFPDGDGTSASTETFHGCVVALGREMKKDSLIKGKIEIKVSGNPGFTLGA